MVKPPAPNATKAVIDPVLQDVGAIV